jgi:hypothetical protein
MNPSYLIETMVELSQGWHVSRLELDWYRATKGLVCEYVSRFSRYDLYVHSEVSMSC